MEPLPTRLRLAGKDASAAVAKAKRKLVGAASLDKLEQFANVLFLRLTPHEKDLLEAEVFPLLFSSLEDDKERAAVGHLADGSEVNGNLESVAVLLFLRW